MYTISDIWGTMTIAELVQEQTELQVGTERANTLRDYSNNLGLFGISRDHNRKGINKILEDFILKQGHVVWVDLGCGNGAALRQGKEHLARTGTDPAKLRAYGFDAMPIGLAKLREYMQRFPKEFSKDILNPEYSPEFTQTDITDVRFPEKPDLITCHDVLFWTKDPLKVFLNAAKQANIGAWICLNRLDRISYSNTRSWSSSDYLFRKIFRETKLNSWFEKLGDQFYDESSAIVKTAEPIEYLFELHERRLGRNQHSGYGYGQGHNYVYVKTSSGK